VSPAEQRKRERAWERALDARAAAYAGYERACAAEDAARAAYFAACDACDAAALTAFPGTKTETIGATRP
jgi:hypothetical protein